jgi:hypothetical protein
MANQGMNPKKALIKPRGKSPETMAVHGTDGKTHIVGIGNLRVIICQEGDAWFAQGLEIDYAASGHSVSEVKKNFEKGLKGTIDLNIKMHSDIEHFLKVAPQDVWRELHRKGNKYHFFHVSLHDDVSKTLGYQGIDYLVEPPCPEVAA